MTNVGETSVPTSTGPLAAHREHSILVLEHLVTHGPATRSELASATGLGRGAIAGLTARLLEAGVLRPAANDPDGDGRAAPLSLSAADHVLITAFIGLDEAVATVASLAGEELARFTMPLSTNRAMGEAGEPGEPGQPGKPGQPGAPATASALDVLGVVLARALARAERSAQPIADVTVLVDGAVAGSPAVVITDTRFGVEPVDVLGELRARVPQLTEVEATLRLPVALEPIGAAAAAAERTELPGIADVIVISGDTGIACSVVARGALLLGAHGLAATFAHLPVVQGGVRCECGQRGCLATVASTEVVLERAGLQDFAAASGLAAALEELIVRVGESDDRARWSWLDAALWIGRALQLVVPTVDPATVVVGGYWSHLIGDIETAYRANRPTIGGGALESIPTFRAARLGADAPLIGARFEARQRLLAEPLLLAG